jgi:hypothetical protein
MLTPKRRAALVVGYTVETCLDETGVTEHRTDC